MARPKKEFSQRIFEELCRIQCTLEEIAQVMRLSEDTVERRCQEIYESSFADTYKKLSAVGKTSLRRAQFKLAQKSAAMAIWLGKQYLGQRDKVDIDVLDARERAERAVDQFMERTGKTRLEAIEHLKPHIPQISELVH
jgi:AraC-like DNA-binding protein